MRSTLASRWLSSKPDRGPSGAISQDSGGPKKHMPFPVPMSEFGSRALRLQLQVSRGVIQESAPPSNGGLRRLLPIPCGRRRAARRQLLNGRPPRHSRGARGHDGGHGGLRGAAGDERGADAGRRQGPGHLLEAAAHEGLPCGLEARPRRHGQGLRAIRLEAGRGVLAAALRPWARPSGRSGSLGRSGGLWAGCTSVRRPGSTPGCTGCVPSGGLVGCRRGCGRLRGRSAKRPIGRAVGRKRPSARPAVGLAPEAAQSRLSARPLGNALFNKSTAEVASAK